MEVNEKSNSSLTVKQRNCAQRNSLLRQTNQRISASIQNEHNLFAKSMEFEAKKLRQKLTVLIPCRTKTNSTNNVRSPTKEEETSEDKLKLPVIRNEVKSAPCSPSQERRRSTFSWDNLNVSSTGKDVLRRGSFNDIAFESQRSSPIPRRKTSRSFSSRGELCPQFLTPVQVSPSSEDGNSSKVSPLMPRNLKLREQARRDSLLKLFPNEGDKPQSPTLEDQFKTLGSCRYLRRDTEGDLKILVKETPD